MKSSIVRARELIRSIADHADPVAEMKSIIATAPAAERPYVTMMWEAFWTALDRAAAERGSHDHD